MNWLFEDPTGLVVAAAVVLAVLVAALVVTRRAVLLAAMAGMVVLVLVGMLVEWLVVTPAERIAATFVSISESLVANDIDGVLAHVDPAASKVRAEARAAMSMVEVQEAGVVNLKVEIDEQAVPRRARAEFFGKIALKDKTGKIPYERLGLEFSVGLCEQDDRRWLVTDYTVRDAPAR